MLPLPERLRSNGEFQQVYREGRSFSEGMVVLHLLRLPDDLLRRVGFSTSKKVGNAVTRNLVKRRLRESYRALLPHLPVGYRAIIVARRSSATGSYDELQRSVRGALRKAGLLTDDVV